MDSDQTPIQQQQQHEQQDSGISDSFDFKQHNTTLIQSTPLTHNPRKRLYSSILTTKTTNFQLNDTLVDDLKDCRLDEDTPEKQRRLYGPTTSTIVTTSPLIERQHLLYGSNYIRPNYKFASPLKLSDCFNNHNNNNSIVDNNSRDLKKLLEKLLNTDLIMANIFKYLSDGDLYRFHLVSQDFRLALLKNNKATIRVDLFKERYKNNKENYVITPPPSPNKHNSPPRLSTDTSRSFREFYGVARLLSKPTQSTMKCPCCQNVAIVENNLSQCQYRFCGYIHCLLCNSYSKSGPQDFYDKCKNSILDTALNDRSNYDNYCNNREDSGICLDNDTTTTTITTPKVKRNLFETNLNQNTRIFGSNHNNQQQIVVTTTTTIENKRRFTTTWCPVIANTKRNNNNNNNNDGSWSSPEREIPKVCSKQSKRNLKRLTR